MKKTVKDEEIQIHAEERETTIKTQQEKKIKKKNSQASKEEQDTYLQKAF